MIDISTKFARGEEPHPNQFQNNFVSQLGSLLANDVTQLSFNSPINSNAGQSDEQDSSNNYSVQGSRNLPFRAQLNAKLAKLGRSDLSAINLMDRATTQSCAGCHQLSNGVGLGANLTWPQSNGFTQIDERSKLSPALTSAFLPARATALVNFINSQCLNPGSGPIDHGLTVGGSVVGAAN